jgi:hypothetical protein
MTTRVYVNLPEGMLGSWEIFRQHIEQRVRSRQGSRQRTRTRPFFDFCWRQNEQIPCETRLQPGFTAREKLHQQSPVTSWLILGGFIVGIIIQTHHKNQPSFTMIVQMLYWGSYQLDNFPNRVQWFYQVLSIGKK